MARDLTDPPRAPRRAQAPPGSANLASRPAPSSRPAPPARALAPLSSVPACRGRRRWPRRRGLAPPSHVQPQSARLARCAVGEAERAIASTISSSNRTRCAKLSKKRRRCHCGHCPAALGGGVDADPNTLPACSPAADLHPRAAAPRSSAPARRGRRGRPVRRGLGPRSHSVVLWAFRRRVVQHHQAAQRARLLPTRARGGHAETADAAASTRPSRGSAAILSDAQLKSCPDHPMGAGHPSMDETHRQHARLLQPSTG